MGEAKGMSDDIVPAYGETAICASSGEDFAATLWPVVIKVKNSVQKDRLIQHLRDLADALQAGVYDPGFDEDYRAGERFYRMMGDSDATP